MGEQNNPDVSDTHHKHTLDRSANLHLVAAGVTHMAWEAALANMRAGRPISATFFAAESLVYRTAKLLTGISFKSEINLLGPGGLEPNPAIRQRYGHTTALAHAALTLEGVEAPASFRRSLDS